MPVDHVDSLDDDVVVADDSSLEIVEMDQPAQQQQQEVVNLLSSSSDDGDNDGDVEDFDEDNKEMDEEGVTPDPINNITPDLSPKNSVNNSVDDGNVQGKEHPTKDSSPCRDGVNDEKPDEVLECSPVARAAEPQTVKADPDTSDDEVIQARRRPFLRMITFQSFRRGNRTPPPLQSSNMKREDGAVGNISNRRPKPESDPSKGNGVVVYEDEEEDDVFWEIDAVLDYKYHGKRLLWLVSWKNSTETSWVQDDDLCDSAKRDAEKLRYSKRLAKKVSHQQGSFHEPIDLCCFDDESMDSWDVSSSEGESIRSPNDLSDDESMEDIDDDDEEFGKKSSKRSSKRQGAQKRSKDGETRKRKRTRSTANATSTRKRGPNGANFVIRRLPTAPFMKSGGLRPEKNGMAMTFTVSNETQEPDNFLRRLVNGRSILKLEYDTASKSMPIAQFLDGGNTYSLVAIKNRRDKVQKGAGHWGSSNQITLKYVQTNGQAMWNPQIELEKVADFQSLPTHKLAARLELLLTPAMKGPSLHDDWDVSMFEMIKQEDSHMGCGFIPYNLIKELYSARRKTPVDSLQVRVFAPCIGIAKGMLTPKLGIDKIQLPPSMIKVGPSRQCKDPWAVMVVKNASPSRYNRDLGRFLDSPRLPKGAQTNSLPAYQPTLRNLSEMYQNLFVGLGAPTNVVRDYSKRQLSIAGRKHAHLMGVCDPTGKLPEGTIFVTGYTRDAKNKRVHFTEFYKRLFVTRSPCLDPTDGRMVPLAGHKPASMSDEEWQWLRDKPFGTIIFARPKKRLNAAPLPAMIADGDLDGDLYFVLFDDKLLPHLSAAFDKPKMKAEQKALEKRVRNSKVNESEGPPALCNRGPRNWFTQAQNEMLKLEHIAGVGKLTGMIYRKAEKLGKESPNGIWDADARAFAKAFKQSLDAYKHGNAIELPKRLEKEVETMDKTKDKSLKSLIQFI